MIKEYIIKTKTDTKNLAKQIAKKINHKKIIITLNGEIGVGKTFFTSCLINKLLLIDNLPPQIVTSPTFNLLKIYNLKHFDIYHYDLYRIKKMEELFELNIEEAFANVTVIEWPNLIKPLLPYPVIKIDISKEKNDRLFVIDGF